MRTETTELYKYDELSEKAQAKARDWWRDMEARSGDTSFAEFLTDDFMIAAKACGLTVSGTNPHNRHDKGLYWSGFSSQGDGASFSATWSAASVDVAALLADRPATYTDADGKEQTCQGNAELAKILQGFEDLAESEPTGYGSTRGEDRGHYQRDTDYGHENDADHVPADLIDRNTETLKELCADLAGWFYRTLEREYEWLMSDESVAENIRCNDYEFTVDGARWTR